MLPLRGVAVGRLNMNYYRMLQDLDELDVLIEKESHFGGEESLKRGIIAPKDIDPTFIYSMEVDEDVEDLILPSYDSEGPIFDKELVNTLKAVGVDNLEIFKAIITNSHTGEVIENYNAVNIVGLISCADMGKSNAEPIADVHYFFDLKINPEKTMGLLMFRLAEQPIDIIVHERVAEAIRKGSFYGIVLHPV